MRVEKDFRDFIALLNRHEVRYLVVGGFAYSFYAEPRYTRDIDILIQSSRENALKVLKTLRAFGFTDIELTEEDIIETGQVIQLGVAFIAVLLCVSVMCLWSLRAGPRILEDGARQVAKESLRLADDLPALGERSDHLVA